MVKGPRIRRCRRAQRTGLAITVGGGGCGGGEERSPRRGLGWARDAADPRTQAMPGDRKRKFACRCLWFSPLAPLRCKSQELPLLGRGRFGAPKHPHLFLLFPLLFGERLGRGGQRREPLCPKRRWKCALRRLGRAGEQPAETSARRAAVLASRIPFPLHLSRRPAFWGGFRLCAYCARTQSSLRAQGGALESPLLPLDSGPSFLPTLPRGGRPGSDQVLYLHTVLQESALGCLPGWQ